MTFEDIKTDFSKYKISQMQLDPFGICNAKCWFCPVKYRGNPASGKETMSPELMEKIFVDLIEERKKENGLVSKSFNGFYTAHYNEILLYKHFDKMLELCRKYKLHTLVLSNGTTLTPEKTDLIKSYRDVINGICLNTPAFEAETWSKRSGININVFPKLINNIKYAYENLPELVASRAFSIMLNGITTHSLRNSGGWIDKGEGFPIDIDLDPLNGELETQFKIATDMFPKMNIYKNPSLIDRAGLLGNVISNLSMIKQQSSGKKFVGCGNGFEVGGRPIGWIHINAAGEAFLCCNDYDFEFKFGNFKDQNLRDFWGSDNHINIIKKSYETICQSCASARYI